MKTNTIFMIMGMFIIITPIIILFTATETIVVGEKLCVDGHGMKNLEGIMCEETESFIFDEPAKYYYRFLFIIEIIGFYMFFSELRLSLEEEE